MPKGRKHSPEEIVKKLRQAEIELGGGHGGLNIWLHVHVDCSSFRP